MAWMTSLALVLALAQMRDTAWSLVAPGQLWAQSTDLGGRGGPLTVHVVEQESLEPLAGAEVRLFRQDGRSYPPLATLATDPQGVIHLSATPEGRLWLVAWAPGFARTSASLERGHGEEALRLQLDRAHRLEVRVASSDGRPLEEATTLAWASDPLPHGALTNRAGEASFDRLGGGPWRLKVTARGFESARLEGVARGPVDVLLRRLGIVRVRVEDPLGAVASGAKLWVASSNLWPPRTGHTDAHGRLDIGGLLAGTYDIRAAHGHGVAHTVVGLDRERGKAQEVNLQLVEGRMVSVLSYDAASDDEPPVSGAHVVLVEDGLSPFPLHGRTRSDGQLTLGPVAPGPATVSVRAAGFVPSGTLRVDALGGGEPLRVGLLRGATLTGEVVDERGYPVAGATIEIVGTDLQGLPLVEDPARSAFRDAHFDWSLRANFELIPAGDLGVVPGAAPALPQLGAELRLPRTTPSEAGPQAWATDRSGRFRASPVTPGEARALVRHPEYLPGESELVRLAPGGSVAVHVVLRAGRQLVGRVLDAHDRPVSGARVQVLGQVGAFQRNLQTQPDGTFRVAVTPRTLMVRVARPRAPQQVVLQQEVTVPDNDRTEIRLRLPEARPSLQVHVIDDAGLPLAGAWVRVDSNDPEVPLRQTVSTDGLGTAAFDDVGGLPMTVSVEAPGRGRLERQLDSAPQELTLTLASGIAVSGRITAIRGRQWVAGARVTAIAEGARISTRSSADGTYRLEGLSAGRVRFEVRHADFAPWEGVLDVARPSRSGRDVELQEINLQEGMTVSGSVVDTLGQPVAGARVAVELAPTHLALGAPDSNSVLTDPRGRFRMERLPAGDLTLHARSETTGRGHLRVERDAGDAQQGLRIVLSEPADPETERGATGAAGVAVTLGQADGHVSVAQVAPGSEAERAGLLQGDELTRIDGAAPADLADARQRLAGTLGSDVLVEINRNGQRFSKRIAREPLRR